MKWLALLACALLAFDAAAQALPFSGASETNLPLVIENLTPDSEVEHDASAGVSTGRHGVVIKYGDTTLSATDVVLDEKSYVARATGLVRLQQGQHLWTGRQLEYNFRTREIKTDSFEMGAPPFFVAAENLQADTSNRVYTASNAIVTTDDVENPFYRIKAKELKITVGESIIARHATVQIGDTPVMYFPYYNRSLKRHPNFWVLTPGYRSRFGAFLLSSYNFQVTSNFSGAFHLDYRDRRGPGIGQDFAWDLGRWGIGDTAYYYTRDNDSMIDPSPTQIPSDRQRIRFSHRMELRTNFTAKINVDAQSDSRVRRDFFEQEFRKDPQPKTFLELSHVWPNYELNVLTLAQVNDFFSTVERLPDIKLSGFRQQLGRSPFYYESESSAAYLRMQSALDPQTNYSAGRFDTFHQILYPNTFFGWLNFEPRVGGRLTHYREQEGFNSVLEEENRFLFNTGAEASFKASRVWAGATNRMFRINGIRHILQPSVNYVFVPDPSASLMEIPQFDTEYPSLRLLPIDFPDYNAIDSIDSQNVVRLGVRNKVQTKRGNEIQNVVNWAVVTDWRLDPNPNQGTFADLYSDLDLRPWSWLTLNSEVRYDLENGRLRAANHSAAFLPGDVWSVSLGHRYFANDPIPGFGPFPGNNTIYTRMYYRFSPNWGIRMSHHFETRDGTMEEQYYTVYRDLRSWTAALTFRHRDHRGIGPDDFAVALTFSLKAFPRYTVGQDRDEPSFLIGG